MNSLGIIGFGNMGEALIAGLKERNPELRLHVMEKQADKLRNAVEKYGATDCNDSLQTLVDASEALIVAIKPQDLAHLAEELHGSAATIPLISIAAGVSISRLEGLFGSTEIARFMPSLAASVGKSVTGVSYSAGCSEEFKNLAFEVAQAIGVAMEMPERLIPAIIGISGSGIAYVFEFIHALALGGVKTGIPYDSSLEVALDVLEGAVSTIRTSGINPSELITRVCSPGGTTIEGISTLHKQGFTSAVIDAVQAARDRAMDLEA